MSVGWLEQQRNLVKVTAELPVTEFKIYTNEDLQGFIAQLSVHFGFTKGDDLDEAVSTVILHASPDMGAIGLSYVGQRVSKLLANKAAYDLIQALREKRKQAETPTQEATGVKSDNSNSQG